MVEYAIAIINGTGDWDDTDYEKSMTNSFCTQLRTLQPTVYYQRGPSLDGMTTNSKGDRAAEFLAKQAARDPKLKILLIGYSRGGSAALYAAHQLNNANKPISVDGLLLFDPVCQHFNGARGIPPNVAYSRTAIRDVSSPQGKAMVAKLKDSISKVDGKEVPKIVAPLELALIKGAKDNPMRDRWGNSDTLTLDRRSMCMVPTGMAGDELTGTGTGRHWKHAFLGTHGALGGVYWPKVAGDRECSNQVAQWMNVGLRDLGLMPVLR